ncbi:3-glucosyltransferase (Asparagine-linked glycosylation protein 8 homolog) (Dol-P-Glc:Glc(1)Man(9)GlcNAc(2)-PP-dolichyl alpha-1 [Durusdinium trenchii]|uniref:Alpha-1,3-glucosyltransferase n=1 Tax=Durusdinium trenchii TaxID=1381693 RepID=A0ABP0QX49_9DINO
MAGAEEAGPTTGESVGVVALLSLTLKVLLLPAYQSQEFEKQRVWMAVVHQLSPAEWYGSAVVVDASNSSSSSSSGAAETWPLDYPPGFAFFKYAQSWFARALEPDMVEFAGGDSATAATFQRVCVILTDQFLLLGILLVCTTWPSTTTTDMEWSRNKVVVVVALILFNPGLLMVDHLHLHFSGCAIGFFLIAVAFLRRGDDFGDLAGAWTIVLLVMFDHTFAPVIPMFAIYLFRHFCSVPGNNTAIKLWLGSRSRASSTQSNTSADGDTPWRSRDRSASFGDDEADSRSSSEEDDDDDGDDESIESIRTPVAPRSPRGATRATERQLRFRGLGGVQEGPIFEEDPMDLDPGAAIAERGPSDTGLILQHLRLSTTEGSARALSSVPSMPVMSTFDTAGGTFMDSPRSVQSVQPSRAGLGFRREDDAAMDLTGKPKRDPRNKHKRAHSEIPRGFRLRKAYDHFKLDNSFKKLLQRPRGVSNLEISSVRRRVGLWRVMALLTVVGGTLGVYMVPFWAAGANIEVLAWKLYDLLVPSGKVVCNPYWAPNIWALYLGFDMLLDAAGKHVELWETPAVAVPGLEPHVLPSVQPWMCAVCTFLAMSPALRRVWDYPHYSVLLPAFVYCMMSAFMLGYHVHEKAVLMIIVPLTLASCDSTMDARLYLLMSWIAHVSLLPILETPDLKALKPVLLLLHCFGSFIALDQYHIMARRARRIRAEPNGGGVWLWAGDRSYFYGLVVTYVLSEVVHPVIPFVVSYLPWESAFANDTELQRQLERFPVTLISVYCAAGMVHCWTLSMQQLSRKISVIESYQWSPRHGPDQPNEAVSDRNPFSLNLR